MKTMTVEEIKMCKIPKGNYYWAMSIIKVESWHYNPENKNDKEKIESLCTTFTVLYALAKGEYVRKSDVIEKLSHNTFTPNCKWFLEKMVNELPTIGTKEK